MAPSKAMVKFYRANFSTQGSLYRYFCFHLVPPRLCFPKSMTTIVGPQERILAHSAVTGCLSDYHDYSGKTNSGL